MKKRMLNEQTTRKFMKLAGLQPLSENFFSNTLDEQEDELPPEEDEEPLPGEAEAPVDELPPEEPMDVGPAQGDVDVHSLVDAIASAIEAETGVTVDVEGGEGEPGLEGPPEEEEEAALEPPPEDELEEPGLEGPPEEEEPVLEQPYKRDNRVMEKEELEETMKELDEAEVVVEDDLDEDRINEVTARVAARILKLSRFSKKNK